MKPLVLGTRGSDLALAQSKIVRDLLEAARPGLLVEQQIITTTGDARSSMAIDEPTAEGAGIFTRQLEDALQSGGIDFAVHSLKDLPVEAPAGLILAAILPRASADDILVSRHSGGVLGLPPGAVIGTSSPRRARLLINQRPDLRIAPIRGNVPTRLAKIGDNEGFDATILAAAGLYRIGHDLSEGVIAINGRTLFTEVLDWMLPAPGQGAIAVETRTGDRAEDLLRILHDEKTASCVEAERLVLRHLGGGCHLALGTLATKSKEGFLMRAVFIPDDEAPPRYAQASAVTPTDVARLVADQLLFQ